MALSDLKSAYSFYRRPGLEPGFRPNQKNQTDFEYNDDLTVSAVPKGFDHNTSAAVSFKTITSRDKFTISDTQGDSSRLNQLGKGSIFPIGPSGQVHNFDITRTGFNLNNRYEDIFSSLSDAGLANTYTKNSPIDDMYNIVKVRDVASRRGFLRQPFILRGIQRDENSDPQRFGPTINLNLPRGGIITNVNRMALDVARISKFLISPEGLLFNLRQFGQQLMNPNVEGTSGRVGSILNPNSTKLYTPINLLANVAGAPYGLRSRRHGLLPFDIGVQPSNYEETVIKGRPTDFLKVNNNRLVGLRKDLLGDSIIGAGGILANIQNISDKIRGFSGERIQRLSGLTGPGSVGGIGATTIRRYTSTPTLSQLDDLANQRKDTGFGNDKRRLSFQDKLSNEKGENYPDIEYKGKSKKSLKDRKYDDKKLNQSKAGDINAYKTLSYGAIKRIAKDRTSKSKQIIDFRTGKEYKNQTVEKYNSTDPKDTFCQIKISNKSATAQFKAYITSLNDTITNAASIVQPNTGQTATKVSAKESPASRQIQLSFLVAATTAKELPIIYNNINSLYKLTYQSKRQNDVRVTIGDFIKNKRRFFVDNVDISWDTEYPWEIEPGSIVPKVLEVSVTLTQVVSNEKFLNKLQISYGKV